MVVGGGHFDHVGWNKIETSKPTQDAHRLPGREATDLRSAGSGSECRVEDVDVQRQI